MSKPSLNELIIRFAPTMPRTVQRARMGDPKAIESLHALVDSFAEADRTRSLYRQTSNATRSR